MFFSLPTSIGWDRVYCKTKSFPHSGKWFDFMSLLHVFTISLTICTRCLASIQVHPARIQTIPQDEEVFSCSLREVFWFVFSPAWFYNLPFNFAHAVWPAYKCIQLTIQALVGEIESHMSHKMKRCFFLREVACFIITNSQGKWLLFSHAFTAAFFQYYLPCCLASTQVPPTSIQVLEGTEWKYPLGFHGDREVIGYWCPVLHWPRFYRCGTNCTGCLCIC